MNQGQQDELSFLNQSVNNVLAPIANTQPFQKNPVFYQKKQQPIRTSNSVLNILTPNKDTNKLEFNDELIDFLSNDQNNCNLNIVTFVGSRQIGKSFLIDFLVSREEKSTSRLLCKHSRPYINMPTYDMRGKNGQKVIFFDGEGELPNDAFLWSYFFSSMIVLNLQGGQEGDKRAEERFLSQLDHVRINLQSEAEDLSLPQLIILRRNATNKQFKQREFLSKVQAYGLFANDIATLNMAYPGTSKVSPKDVKQVAENLLNQAFVNDALNLSWVIKSGRSKTIKGNFIGSKIAGMSLEPVTQSINKTGKIQTIRIWSEVIETLSLGYYNYYMTKYAQQLQKQFADEQPCDKYTLYKRMSKIRRNTDKKFQGFNMIAGDATFQKYRSKVQVNVSKKQKILKDVNKRKSIERNDQLCKKLFGQMNDSNCQQLIQKYCQSKLDDNKTQVLLQNFQSVIKTRLNEVEKSKNPALKPSTEIMKLEKELKDLEDKIRQEKQNKTEMVNFDAQKVKASIQLKEREVRELQGELEKQKKISNEKKANQNKDIVELQQKIEGLRSVTKGQEAEIERLRGAKDGEAKDAIEKLNKKLKDEEDKYQKLQLQVRKAQQLSAVAPRETNPSKKDTCCEVM